MCTGGKKEQLQVDKPDDAAVVNVGSTSYDENDDVVVHSILSLC